jgi:hypothetical protein
MIISAPRSPYSRFADHGGSCRTFWFVCRNDDIEGDDTLHLADQQLLLDQDEAVVRSHDLSELILVPESVLSVRTDRISIE